MCSNLVFPSYASTAITLQKVSRQDGRSGPRKIPAENGQKLSAQCNTCHHYYQHLSSVPVTHLAKHFPSVSRPCSCLGGIYPHRLESETPAILSRNIAAHLCCATPNHESGSVLRRLGSYWHRVCWHQCSAMRMMLSTILVCSIEQHGY